MASTIDCERKSFKVTWTIENYLYCWHKKGDCIESATFIVDTLVKSRWFLRIYPRGKDNSSFVSVFLVRHNPDNCGYNIALDFKFSLLGDSETVLKTHETTGKVFGRGSQHGALEIVTKDEIFLEKRDDFLPQGKLTVCCEMWKSQGEMSEAGQCFSRTRIEIERVSFVWQIKDFSSLEFDQLRKVQIRSPSTNDLIASLDFFLVVDLHQEEKTQIRIITESTKVQFRSFRLFVLDVSGLKVECNRNEVGFFCGNRTWLFPLLLTKRKLMSNKGTYLPEDSLTLSCECSYSTGELSADIEEINHGTAFYWNKSPSTRNGIDLEKSECDAPTAFGDLKSLYNDHTFCDVYLSTKTGKFPSHKSILSARSPVFKTMFTNNMKETTSEYVDIEDLDDDTVSQMLLFIYTETLTDVNLDRVCRLYAAADKYDIAALKIKCTDFLKTNLSGTNACDILVLGDTHQDKDLKKTVQDFIVEYGRNIFASKEWKLLMDTKVQLAAETMFLICNRY